MLIQKDVKLLEDSKAWKIGLRALLIQKDVKLINHTSVLVVV